MQQPDDVRAALVKEIRRREQQIASLREALSQLDAALEAAAKAHAASQAFSEKSLTEKAAEVTRTVRSGIHTAAVPTSPPAPPAPPKQVAPEPVAPPPPVEVASVTPPISGSTPAAAQRPSSAGRYANMKVWRAVQEMLTEHRKSMTMEEIVIKLQEGGASLGENPVRTVSTAVGYMGDKIFHIAKSGGETFVNLLRPADR